MLGFVTTIRHPDNAASFDRVGQLLDATLGSVCRQTDTDFSVVVVHNELPAMRYHHPSITYVHVNFPAPSNKRNARIGLGPGHLDKGYKAVIGARRARELGAAHVMFFDADDYVHHELARHANADPEHPGWYSDLGYIHSQGSRSVGVVEQDFDRKAGSTSIIRYDVLGIPDSLTVSYSHAEIDHALGPATAGYLFGSHDKWRGHLSAQGQELDPLPFPASIWEIGTGENLSGIVRSGRPTVPLDRDIEEAFGLARPSYISHVRAMASRSAMRIQRKLESCFARRSST